MKFWKKGDPVGCGTLRFETPEDAKDYANECVEQIAHGLALSVIKLRSRADRQARIAKLKPPLRDVVREKALKLWGQRN